MGVHRGKIFQKVIEDHGFSVTDINRMTGISRQTLYNSFKNENASLDHMVKVGQAIGYDFAQDIPELKRRGGEPDNLDYKIAYQDLLLRHTKTLEELARIKNKK